ncbi:MAG: hypothetical protein BA863_16585 [Desulfovibrio sp. S3730MH75]|nr:MAG: hypothetical protein BA863_16585 [Desulfovibrio sp. S3730MH75]
MLRKIIFMTLFILIMSTCYASADRVVFYPSGADVLRQVKVNVKTTSYGESVTFVLPGQALPESFSIAPLTKGISINDVSWVRDDLSESPAAVDIGKKIDLLSSKLAAVNAQLQAVEGGIFFWKECGKVQQTKADDVDKIASLVVSNLAKLYNQAVKLNDQSQDLKELIDEQKRKLNGISGQGKSRWIVTVSVAGNGIKSGSFKIGYMLRNCGWIPKYKLDAYPDSQQIKFSFEAEIWQGSGQDFKNYDVALATVKQNSRMSPPNLVQWVIKPVEPESPQPKKYARSMMVMESASINDAVAPSSAPRQVRKSTYSIWELGTKTIMAGPARKYAISSENWNSKFTYLARPSRSSDVFVSAKADLKEARDYRPGQALVLMEGAVLGKVDFSFSGKEKTVFFGADPLLTAKHKIVAKQSGEKGLFGSKQTYDWDYLITLSNARKNMVVIKVQEPAPRAGDKRIKLIDSSKPEAKIKDNNFEWTLEVAAGQKTEIEYGVKLNAPDDMDIDLGSGK